MYLRARIRSNAGRQLWFSAGAGEGVTCWCCDEAAGCRRPLQQQFRKRTSQSKARWRGVRLGGQEANNASCGPLFRPRECVSAGCRQSANARRRQGSVAWSALRCWATHPRTTPATTPPALTTAPRARFPHRRHPIAALRRRQNSSRPPLPSPELITALQGPLPGHHWKPRTLLTVILLIELPARLRHPFPP